jgi:DNA polymerase III epsilon subunit-like protein
MIAFLDIETGGFSTTKNGVCEIALIVVDEQLNPIDTFHTLIKPYKREDSEELVSYKDDAMAINGILVTDLEENGLNVVYAMLNLERFIIENGIKTIAGHNIKAFDIPRVDYLLNRFASGKLSDIHLSDTLTMAKEKLNLPSYSLENLCIHFCIINEKQHSAISDVLETI